MKKKKKKSHREDLYLTCLHGGCSEPYVRELPSPRDEEQTRAQRGLAGDAPLAARPVPLPPPSDLWARAPAAGHSGAAARLHREALQAFPGPAGDPGLPPRAGGRPAPAQRAQLPAPPARPRPRGWRRRGARAPRVPGVQRPPFLPPRGTGAPSAPAAAILEQAETKGEPRHYPPEPRSRRPPAARRARQPRAHPTARPASCTPAPTQTHRPLHPSCPPAPRPLPLAAIGRAF